EGSTADAQAIGPGTAAANHIDAVLSARVFAAHVNLVRPRPQSRHPRRQDRSFRHRLNRLLDDPDRLANLLEPDPVAVVAVAVLARRYTEVEAVVNAVGLVPPEVELKAGRDRRRWLRPVADGGTERRA